MLTRLEVDNFKNLLDFSVDFGPFTCIAGLNGVGKSNIFDAIRFLSLLADHSIMEASLQVRGNNPAGSKPDDIFWEPEDLFWTDGRDRSERLSIAAEMIVDIDVQDDFGRPAHATSTFLRYEVEIGYDESQKGTFGRLELLRERLHYITQGDAAGKLRFNHSAKDFRDHIISNKRRGSDYISTETAQDGQTEILVHQDGGSSGRPQRAPATSAPRTIVGTTNTSTTPTILAARREMQSWRFLALEPSAMRGTDRFYTDPHVTQSGGHLPATLNRLTNANDKPTEDGMSEKEAGRVYARIANRLSEILPVEDVRLNVDEVRQLLTLEVKERSDVYLPARSLSDGTLRFLTLCVLSQDPDFEGLLCLEEPENGIHPARISAMVDLLRDLAIDPSSPPGPDNPLRQVIVATHSPVFVQLQNPEDLLYAQPTRIRRGDKSTTTIRCLPLRETWRALSDASTGMASIMSYLSTPPGAQITLHPLEPAIA